MQSNTVYNLQTFLLALLDSLEARGQLLADRQLPLYSKLYDMHVLFKFLKGTSLQSTPTSDGQPSSRKRRWGSSSSSKKKTTLSISTDSLKVNCCGMFLLKVLLRIAIMTEGSHQKCLCHQWNSQFDCRTKTAQPSNSLRPQGKHSSINRKKPILIASILNWVTILVGCLQ